MGAFKKSQRRGSCGKLKILVCLLPVIVACWTGDNRAMSADKALLGQSSDELVHERLHARLEASLQKQEGQIELSVTLRNSGKESFLVDRELVFLLSIEVIGQDGASVRFDRTRLPKAETNATAWRSRFVRLESGQSVSRHVKLSEGFVAFEWAALIRGDGLKELSPPRETKLRLPAGQNPSKIIVEYYDMMYFYEAFSKYTGLDPGALGLFDGPLTATIQVKE